jgi:hypothetical protein
MTVVTFQTVLPATGLKYQLTMAREIGMKREMVVLYMLVGRYLQ